MLNRLKVMCKPQRIKHLYLWLVYLYQEICKQYREMIVTRESNADCYSLHVCTKNQ